MATEKETQSLSLSDPREIARRFHQQRTEIPNHIGPYKILETLGEGGMGIVYLAEQSTPVHRRVALKIVKLGMDTKQVMARFETEREALALMNHPNVAKVFDAGATDTGRPYFAMEYVFGTPITDYCDTHHLATEDRLLLFIDVCNAIQHAHQKGIIHRDIKPSNVLVTEVDEKASVKVIDFGIAKATQHRLTEATYFTEQGQLIGTPAYMSPEQAGGSGQTDVDTRADVYSLGVLLYEMLVGALPFASEELRRAAFTEIIRMISDVDPPKPSARLAAMGVTSTTIAGSRGTSVKTLFRKIRGELDWIVMKCLEKDRTRRYDTVNALASDIQRYLASEPVLAGPPSTSYRVRKFIRRNRGPVLAAAIVVLVLIGGLAGTTFGLVQAQRERARAEEARDDESAQRKIAEGEKAKAIAARDEAEAVTQFLSETLGSVDPGKEGKDVTVREVLDKSAETIGEKFADKPLIEARLRHTIGTTYYGLGLSEQAETHAAQAAARYRHLKGERDPATLAATNLLATILSERGDLAKGEAQQMATFEIQRRVLGEEHPDTLGTLNNLAITHLRQGRYRHAEELHRKSLAISSRVLGNEHPETLASMNNLALSLQSQGRYAEAGELHRKTLEIRRRVQGEEHPGTISSMNNVAMSLYENGRYADAEALFRQTLEIRHRVLGEKHPDTLSSMNNLAASLLAQGRYAEGEALFRETLEIKRRVLGQEHPETLASMNNLAKCLHDQDRYVEGEALFRQTLEIKRRVQGEEHPDTLSSMTNWAVTLHEQGRYADAEALYRQSLEIQRRVLGEEHRETRASMNNLAKSFNDQGRHAEAEALHRQTLEIERRVLGEEHPDTLDSMNNLANSLSDQGRYAEAEVLYRQTLETRRRVLGDEHPQTLTSMNGLAETLEQSGRFEEAERMCREAGAILNNRLPDRHRDRRLNDNLLGGILTSLGRYAEAEPLLLQSEHGLDDDSGVSPHIRQEMLERIVHLYESWDAAEPGKGHSEKAAEWRAKLKEEGTKPLSHEATKGEEETPKSQNAETPK